jgi:CheY-like chemotaxis protein
MAEPISTRVLLLIEDNPGDAELVSEMLLEAGQQQYRIIRATRMSEALVQLDSNKVDVILLDLRLPDSTGLESVKEIKQIAEEIPIVILTGLEDETLALECINAGAQDYLSKSELRPMSLRRTIGYAITRLREAQIRELQSVLDKYKSMSTEGSSTSVTSSLLGSASVKERLNQDFEMMVEAYSELVTEYVDLIILKREKPRAKMERVVTQLGDVGSGPRDLIDVHLEALDRASRGRSDERSRNLVIEGRLFALEMMGLLVEYYRTGTRR